jgi:hypothetical protein
MPAPPVLPIRDRIRDDALREGHDYTNSTSAAAYLGIADGTLRKWRMRRYGPRFQKIGGEIRYFFADLDAWLEEQFVDGAEGGDAR